MKDVITQRELRLLLTVDDAQYELALNLQRRARAGATVEDGPLGLAVEPGEPQPYKPTSGISIMGISIGPAEDLPHTLMDAAPPAPSAPAAKPAAKIPDWVTYEPQSEYSLLVMDDLGGTERDISLNRDEYFELKDHLAELRGYREAAVKG